jgi:hypothetical protein
MLWIDNEQGTQEYWREQAQFQATPQGYLANKGRFGGAFDERPDRLAVNVLAKQLEESFEEQAEEWMKDQTSFFADLLNAALSRVNWIEIAENLLEDVEEVKP